MTKTAVELAEAQLEAYNNRDIDAFLENYANDCEVYHQATGELMMKGKEQMRARYGELFRKNKNLHAVVINRMHLGDFVIDQEEVVQEANQQVKAIAIYQVENGLIAKVWFIK